MGDHRRIVREILSLARVPGIGPARLRALLEHFKDSGAVLRASVRELELRPRHRTEDGAHASPRSSGTAFPRRPRRSPTSRSRGWSTVGATFVHILDPHYPPHLRTHLRSTGVPVHAWQHRAVRMPRRSPSWARGTRSTYGKRMAEVIRHRPCATRHHDRERTRARHRHHRTRRCPAGRRPDDRRDRVGSGRPLSAGERTTRAAHHSARCRAVGIRHGRETRCGQLSAAQPDRQRHDARAHSSSRRRSTAVR